MKLTGILVLGFFVFCAEARTEDSSEASSAPPAVSEVNSAQLVEDAKQWDGKTICFTGESIGECMERGNWSWIHLNDDAYMWKNIEEGAKLGGYNSGHAIFVETMLARKITFFGDYLHEGDIVRVCGVFHAVCRDHGGDMDIHANNLEIVRIGHPVDHIINKKRLLTGILLMIISIILFWIREIARKRRI